MIIYAEKGNKVRRINEADIQKYANDGYLIKDDKGTVLRETVPNEINALKLAYVKHLEEIANLKAEIESLKSQNKKSYVSNVNDDVADEDVTESKPKRKKSDKAE